MKTENWGVKVTAVEIRDITTPAALQEAMSRQAQAERERRARITLAEAEFQAAQKMVDAANLYSANPRAMETSLDEYSVRTRLTRSRHVDARSN